MLQNIANICALVGVPITIGGLVIAWIQLRASNVGLQQKITSLTEVVNSQNRYSSKGDQFHGCTFYGNPKSEREVADDYRRITQ